MVGCLVAIVLISGNLGLFAILPSGEYNIYGDCEFITNVDLNNGDNTNNDFKDGAWITMDVNNDGEYEKYGFLEEAFSTQYPTYLCGYARDEDTSYATLLVEDFNFHTCSGGDEDDIYVYVHENNEYLFVCSCTGMIYEVFRKNYGVASGAIIPEECENLLQCNTDADTDCDGIVDRTELGVVMTDWINGQVTRIKLGEAIQAWVG